MKSTCFLAVLSGFFLLGYQAIEAQDETPIIPMGSLSAFPKIVQTGTYPTLTWEITIPETVDKVVTIEDPGTIVPGRDLIMDVKVVGNGVTAMASDGETVIHVPVDMQVNYSGQGPVSVFFDNGKGVKPNKTVYSGPVSAGTSIDFGGRYWHNSQWGPLHSSSNGTPHVVALQNGDIPPTSIPLLENPALETFLIPYLDDNGRIKLGARDVIIMMELTETDQNAPGWDLQDAVLLITFYDERTNNGHGNNVDGVDSSNPGNAPFTDSDPTVDDEIKVRGARKK